MFAKLYPHDLNRKELSNDLKDVKHLLKRANVNGEQMDFTPQDLLQYISSMGLEACKTLTLLLTCLTFFGFRMSDV